MPHPQRWCHRLDERTIAKRHLTAFVYNLQPFFAWPDVESNNIMPTLPTTPAPFEVAVSHHGEPPSIKAAIRRKLTYPQQPTQRCRGRRRQRHIEQRTPITDFLQSQLQQLRGDRPPIARPAPRHLLEAHALQ